MLVAAGLLPACQQRKRWYRLTPGLRSEAEPVGRWRSAAVRARAASAGPCQRFDVPSSGCWRLIAITGDRVRRQLLRRGLAAFAAVVLVVVALAGTFIILLGGAVSAQAPDPFVADGDPCCGHPDTWTEVATGLAWTLGLIVIEGMVVAGAIALICWSAKMSWPRWTRLSVIPLT